MAEVEIGMGKSGRRAYGFDDIAIVPEPADPRPRGRRHLLGDRRLPLRAAAHGLGHGRRRQPGHRHRDRPARRRRRAQPRGPLDPLRGPRAAARRDRRARRTRRPPCGMQEIYAEPIKPELVGRAHPPRSRTPASSPCGVGHAAARRAADRRRSSRPSSTCSSSRARSCRPSTCPSTVEPLNLKTFIRELDMPVIVGGCASYQAALHLMRTGAAGVLVGVGPGHACTTRGVLGIGVPQATAIADARAARMRHLDETGVYCHVIADGGMATGGDIAKAIACGADAVMIGSPLAAAVEAPGRGYHWGMAAFHPTLPRGARVDVGRSGTLEEILVGPAHEQRRPAQPRSAALRTSMATCGYETLKEFQKAEVMVAPAPADRGRVPHRRTAPGTRSLGPPDPWRRRHRDDRPGRRLRRAVRPADRPAGARGARLLRDRARTRHRGRAGRAPAGRGDPSRRAQVGARRRARPARPRRSTSSACPCSASATAPSSSPDQLGGEVARTGRGEYGRTELDASPSPGCCCADLPAEQTVWMSHFDAIAGRRRASRSPPPPPTPGGRPRAPRAGPLRRAVPPRGGPHRRRASDDPRTLPARSVRRSGRLDEASIIEHAVEAIRAQVGLGPGHLRPVGRGRLGGGRRAGAQGHRPPAHLRVRRHRADAGTARATRWRTPSAATWAWSSSTCGRPTASSSAWPGVIDPEEKRKAMGELFIRVFEEAPGGLEEARSSCRARCTPTSSSRSCSRGSQGGS